MLASSAQDVRVGLSKTLVFESVSKYTPFVPPSKLQLPPGRKRCNFHWTHLLT